MTEFIVNLWLGANSVNEQVICLTKILLPGLALGSLGYIPYVLIVAVEDFKFQAQFSVIMTTIMLIMITMLAYNQYLVLICWLYVIYHMTSTIGLWIRTAFVIKTRVNAFITIRYSVGLIILLLTVTLMFKSLFI
jgi:hypothetical protein